LQAVAPCPVMATICVVAMIGWKEWLTLGNLYIHNILLEYSRLDFKLLLFSECYMLSSGWFTGICSLNANVTDHSVPPSNVPAYKGETDSVPKHWHLNYRHWWIIQKKSYNFFRLFSRMLSIL
jgi:hypothetical protein